MIGRERVWPRRAGWGGLGLASSWRRACCALASSCVLLIALAAASAAERAPTAYDVVADVAPDAGAIRGRVAIDLANRAPAPIERVYLHLYPNRFRRDGPEVNDITRMYVYPEGAFDPGGIVLEGVSGGAPATALSFRFVDRPGAPTDTLLEVDLPAPLPPGGRITLQVGFTTRLPLRYGPFGVTDDGLTAIAGWYPYLVSRDDSGEWQFTAGPEPARIRARITAPPDRTLVAGREVFPAPHAPTVTATAEDAATFALVLLRHASVVSAEAGATRITFVSPVPQRMQRLATGPPPDELFRETVARAIELRPAALPAPPTLTVVQVPLRWNLTTPSDGPVVVSDRAMHVQELLRGFHEAQIAQAVYAEMLRERARGCATAPARWVRDGTAWVLADRFLVEGHPSHRSVHDWISWFDFFAIVDRFETAPKIPFVQSFFENAQSGDDLRQNVYSYVGDRPPARLVFARLDRRVGTPALEAAVDAHLRDPCTPFARELATATGEDRDRVRSTIADALAPPLPSDVPAIVDPTLGPPRDRSRYQLVLDTADVEVSSTEFGLAALFVARRRYDYTKDIALNPFFTERSYGFNVGPRVHFGPRNDANTYRHNLFAFYNYSWLDRGFKDDSEPGVRTSGNTAALGLRYDYSNVYFYDNPTEQREARVFVDWFDGALGSDYDFVRYGARVAGTTTLGTPRTIGALELLIGFEEPTSGSGVPLQEQYSLGGRRALRGVSVNRKLARNIGLARFEVRQDVYPEVDFNLLDLLTYRRPQLKLFLDTGQVDDSAGRALNPEHFALAAGVGVNILYDFLGFFPGRAYIEVATRLDREQDDFQFLLGTRQAF